MIENYTRIKIFIPKNFRKLSGDTQMNELQKFANYLSIKFGLFNNYTIILSPSLGDDMARFSID